MWMMLLLLSCDADIGASTLPAAAAAAAAGSRGSLQIDEEGATLCGERVDEEDEERR